MALIDADAPVPWGGGGGTDIAWDLDMLGNWAGFDPASGDTARFHNMVNELTGIDTDDNGSDDLTLTYDKAGNMRDRDITATDTLIDRNDTRTHPLRDFVTFVQNKDSRLPTPDPL